MNVHPPASERLHRPLERLTPNPKLKFMEQCREVMRFHRLALRTEEAYLQWIKRFLVFCRDHPHLTPATETDSTPRPSPLPVRGGEGVGAERETISGGWIWRHPKELGEVEVRAFLTDLAVTRRVGAATQNQALNALMFLYREVLHEERAVAEFERVRRPARLPQVLSRNEVNSCRNPAGGWNREPLE